MSDTQTLLVEIGVEELPASYVENALHVLPELVKKRLGQLRLKHGDLRVFGTPRRVALLVEGLAVRQDDLSEKLQGPSAKVAFDKDNKPTRAAEAFASKLGCPVSELQVVETPKGAYVSGTRQEKGRDARELLGPMLAEVCAAIPFRKSMRWSDSDVTFGRPVRWLVALLGSEVVPFEFAGLKTGNVTRGHRFLAGGEIVIRQPSEYVESLRKAHVLVDVAERREMMLQRLREACTKAGVALVEDDFLVRENLFLVEEPYVIVGGFEPAFLALPDDVILAVAKGHQRYFCARSAEGRLAPMYLAVAGTAENVDNVRRGNDRVMRARLSDARFFFEEDLKVQLEQRRAQLKGIVFQDKLGSVLEKVERMERLVGKLGAMAGCSGTVIETAQVGAGLCKCDLATLMVGEFPELQGEMGRVYAKGQGRSEAVADVIRDHYQPKGASDSTPPGDAAALVSLADRFDTLVGCFSIGLSPTGAADPYALRRACLGVIRILLDRSWGISIRDACRAARDGFEGKKMELGVDGLLSKLADFFRDRLRGVLCEKYPNDVVDACLAAGHDRPTDVRDRVAALAVLDASIRSKAGEVFKRATNIAKEAPAGDPVDPGGLAGGTHDTELAVYRALGALDAKLGEAQKARDFPAAFAAIADFAPLLGAYFDNVFVMTDDLIVRENRLRLMRAISERSSGVAHFNLLT
ncbi:MAG: glycine--tRNA ligase subunit beta [Deltaproteobacteria bacterium]|nr:glycine--tRNA ligase subunit beta [Deltaproteobacteria bacterium]